MLLAHSQVEEDGHILFILEIPSEFFSDLNISTAGGLAREPNASFLSPAQICFNPAKCLLFPVVAVWAHSCNPIVVVGFSLDFL